MDTFPKRAKIGRVLRWAFYLILGLFLAQMLWNVLSWSWSSGDYTAAFLVLGMVFALAVVTYLHRRRPRDKFQFLHPWKIPNTTTRGVLWLIAGLDALVALAVVGACMIPLGLLSRTSAASFMTIMSMMMLAALPNGYWLMRRLYDTVQVGEGAGDQRVLLRYRGYSEPCFRDRLPEARAHGCLYLRRVVFRDTFVI